MTDHKKTLNAILANVFETMINGQQVTDNRLSARYGLIIPAERPISAIGNTLYVMGGK